MAKKAVITFEEFWAHYETNEVPGGVIPASISGIPAMLELSPPDPSHGRNGYASHTSAPDGMALDNVSVCNDKRGSRFLN